MRCIKTGFYAQLPSGLFAHGDAFQMVEHTSRMCGDQPQLGEGYLLLRITAVSDEAPSRIHVSLETWNEWFNERDGQDVNSGADIAKVWPQGSTMIVSARHWRWYGYYGKELQA